MKQVKKLYELNRSGRDLDIYKEQSSKNVYNSKISKKK